jgi:hypothetical protein
LRIAGFFRKFIQSAAVTKSTLGFINSSNCRSKTLRVLPIHIFQNFPEENLPFSVSIQSNAIQISLKIKQGIEASQHLFQRRKLCI